ncbi:unnamed protein product [Durusdinium trenchii]|uniref:S1 motif domain-containing protein n=2 Tax=Durusdinium trenchii TaxID=1381693 RepID=A0ABP0Q4H9_9DINO
MKAKMRRLGFLGCVWSLQSRHQVSLVPFFMPGRVSQVGGIAPRAHPKSAATSLQDLSFFEHFPQRLMATVSRKASYGLWADVTSPTGEEATGLIHLSEMDQELDAFEVGQEVLVDVVYVEKERGHLGLSLPRRSWSSSSVADFEGLEVYASEWLEAHVVPGSTGIEPDGVFVKVVHRSLRESLGFVSADLIDLPRESMKSFFKIGDQVHVRLLSKSDGMLQLSMKGGANDIKADLEAQLRNLETSKVQRAARRHDLSAFASMATSQWMDGRIVQIASYGVYVSVEPPGGDAHWGLVHLSEFSEEMSQEALQPGAVIPVRVALVDQENGRLALSARPLMAGSDPTANAEDSFLMGVIEEVHSYGVTLTTPMGRGLLYSTELEEYVEDASSKFAVGEELQVRVIGEMEKGLLALSMKVPKEQSKEISPFEDEESLPTAQDLQIRAMRKRLKDYLGISPQEPLRAQVQAETPFGLLLDVSHPDGREPAQGLLVGPPEDLRTGEQLEVLLLSVDTHRGVLMVGRR